MEYAALIAAAFVLLCLAVWLIAFIIKRCIPTFMFLLVAAANNGFVGMAIFVACWVFMFPVMATICLIGAIFYYPDHYREFLEEQ